MSEKDTLSKKKKKKKKKLHQESKKVPYQRTSKQMSSVITKVIRVILNLFDYFFTRKFYIHKKHKKHKT